MARPWSNTTSKRIPITEDKSPVYNTTRWKELRVRELRKNPFCVIHRRTGMYVHESLDYDHIIPIEYGGSHYGKMNLQFLAKRIHTLKTNREIREKGPIYEHHDGLPVREWDKLLPMGRKPIVVIIGASGVGKSSVIEAMNAEKHWDHVHHIDQSNWSFIADSLMNVPGYHLLECVGSHSIFRKLLMDQRLSFFVIRIKRNPSCALSARKGIAKGDWYKSFYTQQIIPADVEYSNDGEIQMIADRIRHRLFDTGGSKKFEKGLKTPPCSAMHVSSKFERG